MYAVMLTVLKREEENRKSVNSGVNFFIKYFFVGWKLIYSKFERLNTMVDNIKNKVAFVSALLLLLNVYPIYGTQNEDFFIGREGYSKLGGGLRSNHQEGIKKAIENNNKLALEKKSDSISLFYSISKSDHGELQESIDVTHGKFSHSDVMRSMRLSEDKTKKDVTIYSKESTVQVFGNGKVSVSFKAYDNGWFWGDYFTVKVCLYSDKTTLLGEPVKSKILYLSNGETKNIYLTFLGAISPKDARSTNYVSIDEIEILPWSYGERNYQG